MGWTERVARMEEPINACKNRVGTLEGKRLHEKSWFASSIKAVDRETEREDHIVIHLIRWVNECLCYIDSESCID